MICFMCFDKMTKLKVYDLKAGMKYTYAVCEDCRREHWMYSRPFLRKDEETIEDLYYNGDTKTERLVW